MLPFGMDRAFNRIVVCAGVLNVGLAILLAPRLGPMGTAASVVAAQAFVAGAMSVTLIRSRRRKSAETAEREPANQVSEP